MSDHDLTTAALPDAPRSTAAPAWYRVVERGLAPTARVAAIPPAARTAYERAETIIAAAEPRCRLSWHLLAAVGGTSTDHGRVRSFRLVVTGLDEDGSARPAIVGPVLHAGERGLVSDTDAGALDHDPANDRAVGPLHLSPTLWSHVGLDADGDGVRDPQDVDDAALATAVLLCSTGLDLRSPESQTTALAQLNASAAFARRVVRLAEAYRADDALHPGTAPVAGPVPPGAPPSSDAPSPQATTEVEEWFRTHPDQRWRDAPSLSAWAPPPSPWVPTTPGTPPSPAADPTGPAQP